MSELGNALKKIAFEDRGAKYLLTMREEHGNVAPVLLSEKDDPGEFRTDVPYQLVTILRRIHPWIRDEKIAVVSRRCDEKAINELVKRGILQDDRIIRIGLACSDDQIAKCRCGDPVPSKVDIGDTHRGVDSDELSLELSSASLEDRRRFWVRQFGKCNKCYACSTNCPVCVCEQCVLEDRNFVPERGIPPGMAFHLIRAFHLSDKCIECGECERSCLANIPLLTFRKMTNRDMKDLYGFTAGDAETISPLLTTLEGERLEGDSDEH